MDCALKPRSLVVVASRIRSHLPAMAPPRPEFLSVAPQFTVPDVVDAAAYYCDVLGFENRGYFGDPPEFVMLGRGEVEVFFNQSRSVAGQPRLRAPVGYDAYFHVIGLMSLYEELKERGATIIDGPLTRSYGMHEIVIEDCHGIRLAFGEEPGRPSTSGEG